MEPQHCIEQWPKPRLGAGPAPQADTHQTRAQVFSILFTPRPCEYQAITSTAGGSGEQALPSGSCGDCLQKIYSIERGRCVGFTSKELTSLGYEFNAEKVQTFRASFSWRSDLLLSCLDPRKRLLARIYRDAKPLPPPQLHSSKQTKQHCTRGALLG